MTPLWTIYESPLLGPLSLIGDEGRLSGLLFSERTPDRSEAGRDPSAFSDATRQLSEYFMGRRRRFELDLDFGGTPFQRAVWQQLAGLPYGDTVSYTELAGLVGRPHSVRAVAGAVARTPIPVVIPCHRVVGVNGALTGYLGGLRRKAALLSLERRVAGTPP
jgi:methylated-DNA-[protein]-cysteine S-methyltransferase